ncbi:MAG: ribonuclease III domain-containing protein [Candidatus Obscuribacterales bacterium]|nr:ribonuclease III domain-containing protein [Candidatus Obscuribacterales bacterium]
MSRLFLSAAIKTTDVNEIPLRNLAHLGDAVFHLFEREREILQSANAKQMHNRVTMRVNAEKQAVLLFQIAPRLNSVENDIVRRARNLKAANYRKGEQAAYRQATAFEALVGYLYLTDTQRLKEVLHWTLETATDAVNDAVIQGVNENLPDETAEAGDACDENSEP